MLPNIGSLSMHACTLQDAEQNARLEAAKVQAEVSTLLAGHQERIGNWEATFTAEKGRLERDKSKLQVPHLVAQAVPNPRGMQTMLNDLASCIIS